MKIIIGTILLLSMIGCTSSKKKESLSKKENTEVYSAICFSPDELKYEYYDDVQINEMNESGYVTVINGVKKNLSNGCIFEQKYRLKSLAKFSKSTPHSIECAFDPFHYKKIVGTGYYPYVSINNGEKFKLVDSKTRKIILLSIQYCSISGEK